MIKRGKATIKAVYDTLLTATGLDVIYSDYTDDQDIQTEIEKESIDLCVYVTGDLTPADGVGQINQDLLIVHQREHMDDPDEHMINMYRALHALSRVYPIKVNGVTKDVATVKGTERKVYVFQFDMTIMHKIGCK